MKISLFITLIIQLFLLLCAQSTHAKNLQAVLQSNTLSVGTLYGVEGYYVLNNNSAGFEYELAARFAAFLDVELEVIPFKDPKALLQALQQGTIDIGAAPFHFAQSELEHLQFGPVYQYYDQVLVTGNKNANPLLLVEQYSEATTILRHLDEGDFGEWQTTRDYDSDELLNMLLTHEIGYTVANSLSLNRLRLQHPDLLPVKTLSTDNEKRWLLPPDADDAMLGVLLEFFGDVQVSGQLKAIQEAYFAHVEHIDFVDTKAFIEAVDTTLPTYKAWFQEYAGDLDWRLVAALAYQESHWQHDAVSVTGVRGLMMLTRNTASDLGLTSRTDPEQSIRGGSAYIAQLKRRLPARIAEPDRTFMALAAYNVGLGHLEDARVLTQRAGLNPDLWVDVKQYLPLLRKKQYYTKTRYGYAHGDVAVKYVENIRRYYESLRFIDENDALEQEASRGESDAIEDVTQLSQQ
jgi:membrane-bound lytic murein transglycosylase F